MIADYLITNFTTLILLLVLCVTIFTDRGLKIPSARLFNLAMLLIFILTVLEYLNAMCSGETGYIPQALSLNDRIHIRLITGTALYVLRPFIILLELIVLVPGRKNRILLTIPAVLNALLFLPSVFGARFVFWIDGNNRWQATPLKNTVYLVQLLYVSALFIFSMIHFKRHNYNLSIILCTIVILAFTIAFLEYKNLLTGYVTSVTALCVLTYYIYLTSVYKQQLYQENIEKEKQLANEKMELLRSQIQPHFIYNSINIIRTLIRTDKERALETIDDFSDYLKSHFRSIESDDMISFETEIENVKVFLALADADHTREIRVVYDLRETNFLLPQLSLEPIVENAVRHGIGEDGGTITIASFREGDSVIIRTMDTGSGAPEVIGSGTPAAAGRESDRLAVGIANTRKRLELLCNGSLEIHITPDGTTADIIIPATNREAI